MGSARLWVDVVNEFVPAIVGPNWDQSVHSTNNVLFFDDCLDHTPWRTVVSERFEFHAGQCSKLRPIMQGKQQDILEQTRNTVRQVQLCMVHTSEQTDQCSGTRFRSSKADLLRVAFKTIFSFVLLKCCFSVTSAPTISSYNLPHSHCRNSFNSTLLQPTTSTDVPKHVRIKCTDEELKKK
jgi:hypothetical protein